MNPYEILGVDRNANDKAIKLAYRKLVRKWHPDSFQKEKEKENAEHKMQKINEAFEILKNEKKRRKFDMENPISSDVYKYYANKQTKAKTTQKNTQFQKEKQRRAILQFLEVEYKHKEEILEMFVELAAGALNHMFSQEEYLEYLELVLEEQQDCIKKMQQIIAVARQKKISEEETFFKEAQEAIEQLDKKGKETPRDLKQAYYFEETRILTEKINRLVGKFPDRIKEVISFNLLAKTWEFKDDTQLNLVCKKYNKKVERLLQDIIWVQKIAIERKIEIEPLTIEQGILTLKECEEKVKKCKQTLIPDLQELHEKFWKDACQYSNKAGKIILKYLILKDIKGDFICPPHISGISQIAFYFLRKVNSITISADTIDEKDEVELPEGVLSKLIIAFGTNLQSVNILQNRKKQITKKENYICINHQYSCDRMDFVLVDAKGVYYYDETKLCILNGVTNRKELITKYSDYKYPANWKDHELQIHTWAQVTNQLPSPEFMKLFPISVKMAKKWLKLDKTNFEKVLIASQDRVRVIRMYFALGALQEGDSHKQAEWLISRLDINKMYRTRLERFPQEKSYKGDPVFSVPKLVVDFVQKNINVQEFLPYIFAFLEGYELFYAEAKKRKVEISIEFIIKTAPQAIFHRKVDEWTPFVKQLLQREKELPVRLVDKILRFYTIVQKQAKNASYKEIVEMPDYGKESEIHYQYFDLEALETYFTFANEFQERHKNGRRYEVEAENVFLSKNSHAIKIMDGQNKCLAIVILNLLQGGELYADIMKCENKNEEILEAIRRALAHQMDLNEQIIAISIGMNEAPRTSRYNKWREVVQNSSKEWLQDINWMKFECVFESRILGTSYKGYRARFILKGEGQHFEPPHPWNDPKKSRRRNWY